MAAHGSEEHGNGTHQARDGVREPLVTKSSLDQLIDSLAGGNNDKETNANDRCSGSESQSIDRRNA